MHTEISSISNIKIKNILKLQQNAKERRIQKSFVVEGFREIIKAINSGFEISSFLYCTNIADFEIVDKIIERLNPSTEIIKISEAVFKKIAYRENSDGVFIIAKQKSHNIADIKLSSNPLILVAQAIEKPGNVGALLRTADAAKIDAVILCDTISDIYNPNTIRASLGCVFTVQIIECISSEAINFFKKNNINIFPAILSDNSQNYIEQNYTMPTAIIVGSESDGLTEEWFDKDFKKIIIPMLGITDSLNVSVSAAVIIFEAKRQRFFIKKEI